MNASINFSLQNVKTVLRSMRVHGGTFSVTSKILAQDQESGKRTQRVCCEETTDQKFRRHLHINLGKKA